MMIPRMPQARNWLSDTSASRPTAKSGWRKRPRPATFSPLSPELSTTRPQGCPSPPHVVHDFLQLPTSCPEGPHRVNPISCAHRLEAIQYLVPSVVPAQIDSLANTGSFSSNRCS